MKRESTITQIDIAQIEAMAERAAEPGGFEVVQVELKGSGRNHLLRVYIDKPEGVTHADCERVSRELSELLDGADPIPGAYDLEVSSPGVERPLVKWRDWERFIGKKVKVVLKEPVPAGETMTRHPEGAVARAEAGSITLELAGGALIAFPFEQVSRAHLKFEW